MSIINTLVRALCLLFCCPEVCCNGAVCVQIGELTKVTAYCPCEKCCGEFADGVTASGHKIKEGDRFVAADKSVPFRTMLLIPGYNDNKPVPVLDRGGAIKGARLDVFFNTHQEALNWGVKWLKIQGIE